jgi:hypothetical protein
MVLYFLYRFLQQTSGKARFSKALTPFEYIKAKIEKLDPKILLYNDISSYTMYRKWIQLAI